MQNKKINSLSTKIVVFIVVASLVMALVVFSVSKKITQESFYSAEFEKADLIARTIEPLIALNIYLDMQSNIAQLSQQLMENPYILSVKILNMSNETIISQAKSQEYEKSVDESFVVQRNIYRPNSKNQIGTLLLVYSNKGYREIVNKYINLTLSILLMLFAMFVLFGLYLKKLLYPLRYIAKSLKHYSPEKKINIPFSSQNNEIGLISSALNSMQKKISQYAKKQKNINNYLEEK